MYLQFYRAGDGSLHQKATQPLILRSVHMPDAMLGTMGTKSVEPIQVFPAALAAPLLLLLGVVASCAWALGRACFPRRQGTYRVQQK